MPWPAVARMVDLWDVAMQKFGFLANPSFTLRLNRGIVSPV
jgi:hypothetical protein